MPAARGFSRTRTPQDRKCTANDFFWAGLPGAVNASVCGTSDAWTCAVQKLDPVYAIIAGVDTCAHSSDSYTCAVQTFDPVYSILDGAGRLPQDIQNGCGLAVASDVVEIVRGTAATVGIAAGGVRLLRAGAGVSLLDLKDDTGAIGSGSSASAGDVRFARSVHLNATSPAVLNRGLSVREYIANFRDASMLREFPGEALSGTVEDALRGGDSTVRNSSRTEGLQNDGQVDVV